MQVQARSRIKNVWFDVEGIDEIKLHISKGYELRIKPFPKRIKLFGNFNEVGQLKNLDEYKYSKDTHAFIYQIQDGEIIDGIIKVEKLKNQ